MFGEQQWFQVAAGNLGPKSEEPVSTNYGWLYVIECAAWEPGRLAVRGDGSLIVGAGTDVHKTLFEASLDFRDRKFLECLRIKADF